MKVDYIIQGNRSLMPIMTLITLTWMWMLGGCGTGKAKRSLNIGMG